MPKLPDELKRTGEPLPNGNGRQRKVLLISNGQERVGAGDRLGINLDDVERVLPDVRAMLGLAHLVDRTKIVRVKVLNRPDDLVVIFICDLLAAACLCDTLRSWNRKDGDYPTRVYLCKSKVWERLPGDALLSLMDNGKARLNPKWFTIRVLPGDLIPPPMEMGNAIE